MRKIFYAVFIVFILLGFLCGGVKLAAENSDPSTTEEVKEKEAVKEKAETSKTVEEAIKALKPDDPRQARVESLTWQIKYWKEYIRAIQLEYTGLCYKDSRHRNGTMQIERLTRELRRMLIP